MDRGTVPRPESYGRSPQERWTHRRPARNRTIGAEGDRQEARHAVELARRYLYAAFAGQIVVSALAIFFAFDYLLHYNPIAAVIVVIVSLAGFGYAWFAAIAPVRRGNLKAAIAPTIILGLLGIPFGLVVVGVLYILAYLRIRAAAERLEEAGSPA